MKHTLLNPNQLQSFGMLVKDDPFTSDETIRIESENGDAVLPLHTEGTIIYLDTCTLTDKDLSQFPHIKMTSPHPWNPLFLAIDRDRKSVVRTYSRDR